MNSSMARFVRTRERLFHRSKNLVMRHIVLAEATTIGGVEVPELAIDVPEVSPEKGVTYNVGKNATKRARRMIVDERRLPGLPPRREHAGR